MPVRKFPEVKCLRDSEGYPILHVQKDKKGKTILDKKGEATPSTKCVRCKKQVETIADVEKRRKFQVLGYCEVCQKEIMGD